MISRPANESKSSTKKGRVLREISPLVAGSSPALGTSMLIGTNPRSIDIDRYDARPLTGSTFNLYRPEDACLQKMLSQFEQ